MRDGQTLLLEEGHETVEGAQIAVDAARRSPGCQAEVDVGHEVRSFEVGQLADLETGAEETPEAEVTGPETADIFLDAGFAPVALLDALEAGEMLHQPFGQDPRCVERIVWGGFALNLPALVEEETAELHERHAAVVGPGDAVSFDQDVVPGDLQVLVGVELSGGDVIKAEGVPGHGDVVGADDKRAGSAAGEPVAVAFQRGDVLGQPVLGVRRLGKTGWDMRIAGVFERLVVDLASGDGRLTGLIPAPFAALEEFQSSSFSQAA